MNLGNFANTFLSVYKHINDSFVNEGLIVSGQGGLTLMDAYPDDDQIRNIKFRHDATGDSSEILLPIVTIEQSSITPEPFEIGTYTDNVSYRILMTVFAETHLQRDQLTQVIYTNLVQRDIIYFNYNDNFDSPTSGTAFSVSDINFIPVQFAGTNNPALKYGMDCSFVLSKLAE